MRSNFDSTIISALLMGNTKLNSLNSETLSVPLLSHQNTSKMNLEKIIMIANNYMYRSII